jgi:hypothetical protein
MDEADLLGDRIAIMNKGKLRVLGSSLFLKTKFGIGYTLTLATSAGNDARSNPENDLVSYVKTHIPSAEVVSSAGTEISLTLPLEASAQFATLFAGLEDRKEELAVEEYGVSVTSLEEVFLRLAGDEEGDPDAHAEGDTKMKQTSDLQSLGRSNSHLGRASSVDKVESGKPDGDLEAGNGDAWSLVQPSQLCPSLGRQVKALVMKRLLYARRSRKFAMLQVVLPILMTVAGIIFAKVGDKAHAQPNLGNAVSMPLNTTLFLDGDDHYFVYVAKPSSAQASSLGEAINTDFKTMGASKTGPGTFDVTPDCCTAPVSIPSGDITACKDQHMRSPFPVTTVTPWCEQGARVIQQQHTMTDPKTQFAAGVVDVVTNSGKQPAVSPSSESSTAASYAGYRIMVNSTVFNSIPVIATLTHSALFRFM